MGYHRSRTPPTRTVGLCRFGTGVCDGTGTVIHIIHRAARHIIKSHS